MIDALTRVCILPIWTGPVDPKPMTGIINLSFFVEDAGQRYVVRFGRDYPQHHVIRSREVMMAKAAYEAGFSSELIYEGPGVVVGRYLEGTTFTAESLRSNLSRVVPRLRDFHTSMMHHVSGPGFMLWPFHVIRDYARQVREGGLRSGAETERWIAIANEMERAQVPLPLVISHNDMVFTNVIDGGHTIWFIDFEYAGFSTPIFDLAGMAGHAGLTGVEHDHLLHLYFGTAPTPELRRAYDAMLCIALLREALWGVISEAFVDIRDMDFVAYSRRYMARFETALEYYRAHHGIDGARG